jgi:hypothetical protein
MAVPLQGRPHATRTNRSTRTRPLVLAVVLGVMTARLGMMFFGVAGMAVGAVSVVRRFFVIAGLVVLGGFTVMLGGMLVMFGGLVMMFDGVFAHVCAPDSGG